MRNVLLAFFRRNKIYVISITTLIVIVLTWFFKVDQSNGWYPAQILAGVNSEEKQYTIYLEPVVSGGGVNLSFWSDKRDVVDVYRPLNIKVHGRGDYYDPLHNHVSFYTSSNENRQVKAFEWQWGQDFDGSVRLPSMGLLLQRRSNAVTGDVTPEYGIKIESPRYLDDSGRSNYGIFIENQFQNGMSSYAIYSEGGDVLFNGDVQVGRIGDTPITANINGDLIVSGKISSGSTDGFDYCISVSICGGGSKELLTLPFDYRITFFYGGGDNSAELYVVGDKNRDGDLFWLSFDENGLPENDFIIRPNMALFYNMTENEGVIPTLCYERVELYGE